MVNLEEENKRTMTLKENKFTIKAKHIDLEDRVQGDNLEITGLPNYNRTKYLKTIMAENNRRDLPGNFEHSK